MGGRLESSGALQRRSVRAECAVRRGAGHVPDGDRAAADVVLPAANAYEKAGTFTNTAGDLQLLQKAGDVAGVTSDFDIIVRIADRMGYDIRKLVPFGGDVVRADFGQSRGAQSGEADRHAVWLAAHNLEPKVSPFDPMAMLDEIQRLVPGYDVSRLNLLGGNEEHTQLVQITGGRCTGTSGAGAAVKRHVVYVGYLGTLFEHVEFGDGAQKCA